MCALGNSNQQDIHSFIHWMCALVVSFSSCFNEQSSQSNVVFAVPGISANHGNAVGLCKFCHLDDVCSRTVQCSHVQHVLLFGSNLLSEVFSQAVHETLSCIVVVLLFAAGVARTEQDCVVFLDTFGSKEWMSSEH